MWRGGDGRKRFKGKAREGEKAGGEEGKAGAGAWMFPGTQNTHYGKLDRLQVADRCPTKASSLAEAKKTKNQPIDW